MDRSHMKTRLLIYLRGLKTNISYLTVETLAGYGTPASYCESQQGVL